MLIELRSPSWPQKLLPGLHQRVRDSLWNKFLQTVLPYWIRHVWIFFHGNALAE